VGPEIDMSGDLSTWLKQTGDPALRARIVKAIGSIRSGSSARLLLGELGREGDAQYRKDVARAVPEIVLEDAEYEALEGLFRKEADLEVKSFLAVKIAAQMKRRSISDAVLESVREGAGELLRSRNPEKVLSAGKIVAALAESGHSMAKEVLARVDELYVDPKPSDAGLVEIMGSLANEPDVMARVRFIASPNPLPSSWREAAVGILMSESNFPDARGFVLDLYEKELDKRVSYSLVMKAVDLQDVSLLRELLSKARAGKAPFRQGEVEVLTQIIPVISLMQSGDR
jgi:hypothetical protein